jgi:hypothetical protein
MGRTKGSKNKSKELKTPIIIQKDISDDFCKKKIIPIKEISTQDWVLSKTVNGTPVAITGIIKSSNEHFLMVRPRPENKEYQTYVISTSIVKPKFPNEEVKKEFDGVIFAQEE